jgi:hypothetical protein
VACEASLVAALRDGASEAAKATGVYVATGVDKDMCSTRTADMSVTPKDDRESESCRTRPRASSTSCRNATHERAR